MTDTNFDRPVTFTTYSQALAGGLRCQSPAVGVRRRRSTRQSAQLSYAAAAITYVKHA